MRARVQFTGIGGMGPVYIYVDSVTSVFSLKPKYGEDMTGITVQGSRDPHAVAEPVQEVIDALDAAEAGLPNG